MFQDKPRGIPQNIIDRTRDATDIILSRGGWRGPTYSIEQQEKFDRRQFIPTFIGLQETHNKQMLERKIDDKKRLDAMYRAPIDKYQHSKFGLQSEQYTRYRAPINKYINQIMIESVPTYDERNGMIMSDNHNRNVNYKSNKYLDIFFHRTGKGLNDLHNEIMSKPDEPIEGPILKPVDLPIYDNHEGNILSTNEPKQWNSPINFEQSRPTILQPELTKRENLEGTYESKISGFGELKSHNLYGKSSHVVMKKTIEKFRDSELVHEPIITEIPGKFFGERSDREFMRNKNINSVAPNQSRDNTIQNERSMRDTFEINDIGVFGVKNKAKYIYERKML
jgi:hypothetical protein